MQKKSARSRAFSNNAFASNFRPDGLITRNCPADISRAVFFYAFCSTLNGMILNLVKIALFLIVNAAGFFTVSTVYVLATKFGVMPNTDEYAETAHMMFFRIGPFVWPVAALFSIGYFFASRDVRPWLLLAPIYVPALYTIGIIVYFHFFYA